MHPELISKAALTLIFTCGLVMAALTALVAVGNLAAAWHRVRVADPAPGTPQAIVAAQIVRSTVAACLIALAVGVFSGQALLATRRGEFALTADSFSYVFLAAVYTAPVVRCALTVLEWRDRRLLDQLHPPAH